MSKKTLTDNINEHPLIAIGGTILIVLGLIEYIFGGVSFSYNILKDHFSPEPPIIIIKSRVEYNTNKDKIMVRFNENNEPFLHHLYLIDDCGILLSVDSLKPPNFNARETAFVRFGQENLTWSVAIITDKREEKIPLHIYSHETKFSIQKNIAAVQKSSQSIDVEGLNDIKIDIDLSLLIDNQQTLFDLIPEKDEVITFDCLYNNCKVVETKYILTQIPMDWESIGMERLKIDNNLTITNVELPKRNPNKISKYQYISKYNKFVELSGGNIFSDKDLCNT